MKLYLAVAALLLVLLAHTEAQEEPTVEEPTVKEHFANIHTKLKEFGEDLSEKAISALKKLEESELASKTRSWITENIEKLKQKIDETFTTK
ncbi:apolipoprotein C-I [Electrophorus electricus]|uniref:Apolipoprotein C-I n=1 Tax=Electrophorus electricus TaxID=8005 RepID=A0A4W4EPP7_ELEEL|nr:apolipoprotein C-I [Electrophorus electricus]